MGMTLLFVAAGVLFVFDTTYFFSHTHFGDGYRMITKHAISIVLGGTLMWGLSRCRSYQLEQWARPIFFAALVLLARSRQLWRIGSSAS